MKRINKKIFNWFIVNQTTILNFVMLIVNVVMLIMGYKAIELANYSINLSKESINESKRQFESNQKSSDDLFKIQLLNEKANNDSIISHLEEQRKLTDKQVSIVDKQLSITTQTLKDQINAGRPILAHKGIDIKDLDNIYENIFFSPIIIISFLNEGKRTANNLSARIFTIYDINKNKMVRGGIEEQQYCQPNSPYSLDYYPKILIESKNHFYICFDISYTDSYTKNKFYDSYYFEYSKIREKLDFILCKPEIRPALRKEINKFIIENQNNLKFNLKPFY